MARFNDLYEAVLARDCARLRQLVRGGADINCRDSMKRTVLHYAAYDLWVVGMKRVIQTLVDLGADINAGDIQRRTPLHYFLTMHQSGNADETAVRIVFLTLAGADINAKFDTITSLHRAIQQNNILGIETLLKLGVNVNANKRKNYTAFQAVLEMSRMSLLGHLVKLGADINSLSTNLPPLSEAVKLGRLDIVKLLVQYGANVNADIFDVAPVFTAVARRIPHVLKSLGQLGADFNTKLQTSTIVNETVKVGRVDILEYLVRHGADILDPRFKQFTALEMAVCRGFHEMVDCLLKNGADVNVRYDQTLSPFLTAMRLGDTDMVRALAMLAPCPIDAHFSSRNNTILQTACRKDPKILELLLKYGGDVNLKYDYNVTLVHEAVALGNGEMLRVLAELGADLNQGKEEGLGLVDYILEKLPYDKARTQSFIRVLVEAGVDFNQSYNDCITPLHDAVRLGDLSMVQILGELKVNVNELNNEATPLSTIISKGRTDLVRYFAKNGIDLNRTITTAMTPLHDAVRRGDVDVARVLIYFGADTELGKNICTHLNYAVFVMDNDMVRCLLECGADINAKSCLKISALHDAVENSDVRMIDALTDYHDSTWVITEMQDQVTPLGQSILIDQPNITETLLKYGADMNSLHNILATPLDVALDQGKVECALLLISRNVEALRDSIGLSPFHLACQYGHIDQARLLIIEGSDVSKQDYFGRKPFERLLLVENADYHVLQETTTTTNITEQVLSSSVSTSGCQDMNTSLHTPGIGDVKYISSPSAIEVSQRVNQLLTSSIQLCKTFPRVRLNQVGSSAEGTRVGLPNEMDFLLLVQLVKHEERTTVDLGNGYAKYDFGFEDIEMPQHIKTFIRRSSSDRDRNMTWSGSAGFHSYFVNEVMNDVFIHMTDEKVSVQSRGSKGIKDTDRKACSLLTLCWNDGRSAFSIPVDIVPSVHIDNWPKGATTRTWLMGEKELRSRGYVLVPKPPHAKSDLAKKCTEEELKTLWKISFPHLETEHMQRLEQRVKDVYITAKSLRNPDVCRIMITDEGSLPRTVSRYVTSYQLKMCFFQNVEYFLQHEDLCLEEMVCKVYDDLVLGLSKNFIPLFFLPKVSALSGINVDVPKCLRVAKIMARFVRALCLRDYLGDIADGGDDMVMTVYQRHPGSVYRVHDISDGQDTTVYQRNPRPVHRH